jgi:hypothetical protein
MQVNRKEMTQEMFKGINILIENTLLAGFKFPIEIL